MTNVLPAILVDTNVLVYVYDPRDHDKAGALPQRRTQQWH